MLKNIYFLFLALYLASGFVAHSQEGLDEILGKEEHVLALDNISKSIETKNSATLMHLGKNSKPKRFDLVKEAQEYIFITVPYWFGDEEGREFFNHVAKIKKARPDLDIKVMVDWTSPASTKDFFADGLYKDLEKLLGKKNVIQWNKIWNLRSYSLKVMTNRIHDKIFVVDGRHMIAGGMNIGNDYMMGGANRKGWHDTDIYIKGPAAQEGSKIFLRPFLLQTYLDGSIGHPFPNRKKHQIEILQNLFYRDIDKTTWPTLFFGLKRTFKIPYRPYLENERYFPTLIEEEGGPTPVRLIYDNPMVDRRKEGIKTIRYSKFLDTLEYVTPHAKKSLRMFIPYLTISKRMMKFLLDQAKRLNVEIITNSLISHDLGKFNYQAALPAIKQLVNGGVKVYEWQGHSRLEALESEHKCIITDYWPGHTIHTKAIILDQEVAFLGSHNFNVRSEKHNSEIMIMLRDKNLAKDLDKVFEYDLDREENKSVNCGDKILTNRPPRTELISEEYLEKQVKGLKYKLLPLLYPVM